jgi:hypothetical protein
MERRFFIKVVEMYVKENFMNLHAQRSKKSTPTKA